MKETRIIQSNFEIREAADGQPTKIVGTAAIENIPTVLYEETRDGVTYRMIEVIKPGAFDNVMKDDVRALFNHNRDNILGRTTAGTLRIAMVGGRLNYEIDPPETTVAKDLMISMKRGDINQSSYGFEVGEDNRSVKESKTEYIVTRSIGKFSKLHDVSPVTYPATPETTSEIRSQAESFFTREIRTESIETPNLNKIDQKLKIRK